MTMTRYPIAGPWKGIVTDQPSATNDNFLDDCENMFCRKGRIQSRPRWSPTTFQPPDGQPIRGIYTFQDALNNFHTVLLTAQTAYMYNAQTLSLQPINVPGGTGTLAGTGLPYALQEINNQLYFCNGSLSLSYFDGSDSTFVAGDVPGACRFLTENSESLIGAFWTEGPPGVVGSTQFPFRVRWSDTGNPLEWINAPDNTAGANDLIEAGGALTAIGTIGRNTYVLRKYGATVMFPTGQALPAFEFEPFMWSKPGWGNFYPYAFVIWGPQIITITESAEVLLFDGSNFNRLSSGKIQQQLQADIALTTQSGGLVQAFGTASLGPFYSLEAYWIALNGKTYVYDLIEGTWQIMVTASGTLTSMGRIAIV